MNKRARNRLIGVTAIIIIAVAAIIYGTQLSGGGGAYTRVPSQVVSDKKLIGQRVQVTGPVVAGSWDKRSNPMVFSISDSTTSTAATLKVVYYGGVPSTFFDGTPALVTGTVEKDGSLKAQTLVTKCPTKYESATRIPGVASILAESPTAKPHPSEVAALVRAGSIKPQGSFTTFELVDSATASAVLVVKTDQALPAGFKDGAKVVVRGVRQPDGTYTATSVAIATGPN